MGEQQQDRVIGSVKTLSRAPCEGTVGPRIDSLGRMLVALRPADPIRFRVQQPVQRLLDTRTDPIPAQGRWLASVLRGHVAYYGVPNNARALNAFRTAITQRCYRSLRRRGQRRRLNWRRMDTLATRWLAPARIVYPWPGQRFDARNCDKSPGR